MDARDVFADDSVADGHTATTSYDSDSARGDARISRDDAFRLLQDERRRAVLRFLRAEENSDPTPLSTLTSFVAGVAHRDGSDGDDSGDTGGTPDAKAQDRARVSLHHSHLPMLEEYGVVKYDSEDETVEPKPLLAALTPFLADEPAPEEMLVVEAEAAE
ncbi:hypothetical protein C499_14975 [Halogeometricum borinquense DSM 11551]|uniref:DUF7344 domain-containing protein n=2 Tax=Halogeometricum borinquense TaxID=60847 RepID=E4NTT8_HALBP|nr:hypothetical protein [Halogeometricum borinquense]ADQ68243.1 hypothetical protein Hbor_26960 [Halogeometricum borinquense DSM 11551]ELY24713.1 hypothetical protein C499_14975 [Halogeometricum borinquense DSM 11551]RYJ12862.1 hypothetical protein ELS19_02005 [Halogeometricum borinquense]